MTEGVIVLIVFGILVVFGIVSYYFPFGLWISAWASGLSVSP